MLKKLKKKLAKRVREREREIRGRWGNLEGEGAAGKRESELFCVVCLKLFSQSTLNK